MEQHLIPQQISSYEFRLVGDMTLKQFAEVAGGCLLAIILYASPLPGYIKWPFVLLFAIAGIGMAFVPIEERPLETWVLAFLKTVYSPTQFLWRKGAEIPEVFEERAVAVAPIAPILAPGGDKKRLAEYLSTLAEEKNILDEREKFLLDQVNDLFSITAAPLPTTVTIQPAPPKEPSRPIETDEEMMAQILPRYVPPPLTSRPLQEEKKTTSADFSPEIPMPSIPEIPNILVGMVLDKGGKIVEGAILEIRDNQGNPVRALRTNKLGQFRIATPLTKDTYEIETEKEGLIFDVIKVTLKGEIIQPIKIQAMG